MDQSRHQRCLLKWHKECAGGSWQRNCQLLKNMLVAADREDISCWRIWWWQLTEKSSDEEYADGSWHRSCHLLKNMLMAADREVVICWRICSWQQTEKLSAAEEYADGSWQRSCHLLKKMLMAADREIVSCWRISWWDLTEKLSGLLLKNMLMTANREVVRAAAEEYTDGSRQSLGWGPSLNEEGSNKPLLISNTFALTSGTGGSQSSHLQPSERGADLKDHTQGAKLQGSHEVLMTISRNGSHWWDSLGFQIWIIWKVFHSIWN